MADAPVIRVVLADDNTEVRRMLATLLHRDGRFAVVAEAGNGAVAIELAREHQPDLVILDVAMPVLDGIAALPGVRAAAPDARVVMLSGFSESHMGARSLAGGATAYLEKGGSTRNLVASLVAVGSALDAVAEALATVTARMEQSSTTPRQARRLVAGAVERWDCSDVLDTITLLTSEVVTNAIQHAGTQVEVGVELLPHALRVTVTDGDPTYPVARGNDNVDATSGRGLTILDSLAGRWGVRPLPTGKAVWFEVPRPDALAQR
jgi:DNA-binding NarL/FixJ family response regulator